ncbi:MAG: AhpC/TSA family protein [Tannerella sp.]|nr:AhpC/TSA family protein [Tannerella sp.]
MRPFIFNIISVVLLLSSCGNNNLYKVEGELSNLSDSVLYIAYESPRESVFDTIQADSKGQFKNIHEEIEDLQSATIFFDGKEKWFTFYPEAGKTVQIKGDAQSPKLIRVKGGRINDKLNEYKNKVASLLEKELSANDNLELRRITQDFIAKNPKEKASAILISEYFSDPENIAPTEELLNILSPELADFYIVKDLKNQIDKAKMSMVGAKAPAFNVKNIYGETFTPDSFLNKHYILAFTALWCDLCQTEILMLDQISSEYSKDSLEIMMISLDDSSEDVFELLKGDSIQWNLVIDSASQSIELFDTYNVNSLPNCLLMDKEGVIKLRTTNGAELKQAVDEIFK